MPPEFPMPEISPKLFALNSIQIAVSSADKHVDALEFGMTAAQRMALLEEMVFFHHFMAFAALFSLIPDGQGRRRFIDGMMAAIASGTSLPAPESLGLSPVRYFSDRDRDAAIKRCFSSVANIAASMRQELYLKGQPSEAELAVMKLKTVREITGWDTGSASVAQYFAAALLARLTIALELNPPDRYFEFLKLGFSSVAEALAAFDLYVGLLGC